MENNGKLKVELVALNRNFDTRDPDWFCDGWGEAYNAVLDRINSSRADLLVFAGGALKDGYFNGRRSDIFQSSEEDNFKNLKKDFKELKKNQCLSNPDIVVLIEEWGNNIMHLLNYKGTIDLVENDKFQQLFTESSDLLPSKGSRKIDGTSLLNNLYNKMSANIFKVKDKRCAVLQCGELNFLEYTKSGVNVRNTMDGGPIVSKIESLFNEKVDVVLNVIHTPMGEMDKVKLKWRWLSDNNRACLSVCNCMKRELKQEEQYIKENSDKKDKIKIYSTRKNLKDIIPKVSTHYVYINNKEEEEHEIELHVTHNYISRTYEI